MNWSFIVGVLTGINLAGWVYATALRREHRRQDEFEKSQLKRIDDLSEWNARKYDEARREIGLPPRRTQ